jgi:hypothetical protein
MNVSKRNYIQQRKGNYFLLCDERYFNLLISNIDNIDSLLENKKNVFYKNDFGDTTTIAVVPISDYEFVIKRYNVRSFLHFFKNIFRLCYAKKAWRNIIKLQEIDVPTLTPVAYIEKHIGPFKTKSYLITEYVVDAIRGCDYFAKEEKLKPEWDKVIANIAATANKLRSAFIEHCDFQYGNFLIAGNKAILHDLEHMKFYKKDSLKFRQAFQRDIDHFLSFVKSNPEAYQRFIAAFNQEINIASP